MKGPNVYTAKAESAGIQKEVAIGNHKLTSARQRTPKISELTGEGGAMMFSAPTHSKQKTPLPLGDPRDDAMLNDNDSYQILKAALFQWESKYSQVASARERAFYSALRTMLQEGLRSGDAKLRNEKLAAAYAWYSKNKPALGPPMSPRQAARSFAASPSAGRIRGFTNYGPRSEFFSVYSRDTPSPLLKEKISKRKSDMLDRAAQEAAERGEPFRPPSVTQETPEPAASPRSTNPAHGRRSSSKAPASAPGAGRERWNSSSKVAAASQKWQPKPDPWKYKGDDYDSDDSMDRLRIAADEDAHNVEKLRERWRASETQDSHWLMDIQEAMNVWSLQRARVEEEMVRRQEASRYSSPFPNQTTSAIKAASQFDMLRDQTFLTQEESRGGEADDEGEDSITPGGQDEMLDKDNEPAPIWLSPYTRPGVAAIGPSEGPQTALPRTLDGNRGQRPASALLAASRRHALEIEAVAAVFERRGEPLPAEVLERALSVPPDKPYKDCIAMLPRPGAYLPERDGASKGKKGKRGKRSAKGKRSKSPRSRQRSARKTPGTASNISASPEMVPAAPGAADPSTIVSNSVQAHVNAGPKLKAAAPATMAITSVVTL